MATNLKSLEEELRAEMSKNALVRIKRGLSQDQDVSVALEAKPVKKSLFPAKPPQLPQNQTEFPSTVTAKEFKGLQDYLPQFHWLDVQQ